MTDDARYVFWLPPKSGWLKKRREDAEQRFKEVTGITDYLLGAEERFEAFVGHFQRTERDIKLQELADRYHATCEAFDRLVCTGPVEPDGIMPASPREMYRISANAAQVFNRLATEAQLFDISRAELQQAISKWRPR